MRPRPVREAVFSEEPSARTSMTEAAKLPADSPPPSHGLTQDSFNPDYEYRQQQKMKIAIQLRIDFTTTASTSKMA